MASMRAIAFTSLFWPEFIEVEGCVLLKERYSPTNLEEWLTHYGGDRTQTEAMINHTHLYDLFSNSLSEVSLEALEYLGTVLLCTWRSALASQFPARQFRLDLATEPDDYGPTIYISSVR